MKITVIGCGNAFSKKSFNQSFVVEESGRKMLIDCGSQTPAALLNSGFKLQDIDDIYISHLHADHIGGLEEFAFIRYDWANRPRKYNAGPKSYAPRIYGNVQLLKDLWDKSLRGGLESMEGFMAHLDTFFEPMPIEPNVSFEWQGWTVELIQQIHVMSGSMIMPSFGIAFSKEGHESIYFTTDSQHCSPRQIEDFYRRYSIIVQDTELDGMNMLFAEGAKYYKDPADGKPKAWPTDDMEALTLGANGISPEYWSCYKFSSGVHASYGQLAGYPSANSIKLSPEIKAKMRLSHLKDFYLVNKDMYGNDCNWNDKAKADGFHSMLKVGDVIEI